MVVHVLSITTSEKHDWEAFVYIVCRGFWCLCADIDVGTAVAEKMCTCLGNRVSGFVSAYVRNEL